MTDVVSSGATLPRLLNPWGEWVESGDRLPEDVEFCVSHLRAGDVFVDVGANIGLFAAAAAEAVGSSGRVLCFEPSSQYAAALRENIRSNRVGHIVEVVQMALGAEKGTVNLVHCAQTASTVGFYTDGSPSSSPDPRVNGVLERKLREGVFIYSTGGPAKALSESLGSNPGSKILGFFDSFKETGGTLEGKPVFNVRDGLRVRNGHAILITGMFRWEIEKTLRAAGLEPETDFLQVGLPGAVETVRADSLDRILSRRGLERVDFMKIDVDGGECAVLEGALETVRRFQPKLYIEVNNFKGNPDRIWAFLENQDYLLCDGLGRKAVEGKGEFIRMFTPSLCSANFFAAPAGRIA